MKNKKIKAINILALIVFSVVYLYIRATQHAEICGAFFETFSGLFILIYLGLKIDKAIKDNFRRY